MRVVLINLYPPGTIARYMLSSYVLKTYMTKYYKDNNLAIDVLNFSTQTDTTSICEQIIKAKPLFIGYSCYIWNIEKISSIIETLRRKIKARHVLGGPEIFPERIMTFKDPRIGDYYIIGEGERKLLALIKYLCLPEGKDNGIFPKGVACWKEKIFFYKRDGTFIKNLDKIPSIYLDDAIEDRLYRRQEAFMETQRGCRFKCKYCVYHKNMPSISYHSLHRVFEELRYLITEKKVTALRMFDPVFTSDINRAKKIVRFLLKLKEIKGVRLPWIYWEVSHCNIDEEFIELTALLKYRDKISNINTISPKDRPQHYSEILKDYTVVNCLGIQSFNKVSLKAVGRYGIGTKSLAHFMDLAKKYNIALKIDLIMDLPFETFDSYFLGLESFLPYLKGTDHILNIHRLQILPGSKLETLTEEYGIEYSKDAPHFVFQTTTFSRDEIVRAAKLTALLFRVINSPFRNAFFDLKEQSGKPLVALLSEMFDYVSNLRDLMGIQLISEVHIDDTYWNDRVFRELPSLSITDFLKRHSVN